MPDMQQACSDGKHALALDVCTVLTARLRRRQVLALAGGWLWVHLAVAGQAKTCPDEINRLCVCGGYLY